MTAALHVPDTLSTGAREALSDLLHSAIEVPYLLDPATHDQDASVDVGAELVRAGYLTIDGTNAQWSIEVAPPMPLPSDLAQGAHDAVDKLSDIVNNSTRDNLATEHMGTVGIDGSLRGYQLAVATRSVLQLALHAANGRLAPEAVATHFTYAAANLARAINQAAETGEQKSAP